jgi:hypothetical protein
LLTSRENNLHNQHLLIEHLYTCVTGDLPALAEMRVVRDSLIEPKEINPQLSDRVNQAIMQGMALKWKERSSTVEQWLRSSLTHQSSCLIHAINHANN